MNRFPRALDQLAALPPVPTDDYREATRLERYVYSAWAYHRLGVALTDADLARVAALWKHRGDLRPVLSGVVYHYPCEELLRAFRRAFERSEADHGDVRAWLAAYPTLRDTLRPYVVERAGRFNTPFVAVTAALLWARHFGGGDEAFRAAANAIHRDDRRQKVEAVRRGYVNDFLRHDLTDHGRLFADELNAINRRLVELGTKPLTDWVPMYQWWTAPPVDYVLSDVNLGYQLSECAMAEHRFAGADWGDADERAYAARLIALSPMARKSFHDTDQEKSERSPVLARVRELAAGMAAPGAAARS